MGLLRNSLFIGVRNIRHFRKGGHDETVIPVWAAYTVLHTGTCQAYTVLHTSTYQAYTVLHTGTYQAYTAPHTGTYQA